MKIREKLKNVWEKIKDAYSCVAVGFVTVILGIFLGFVGRRKNVSDNSEPENRIRDDTEELRRNTDKLSGATDRLRENNERLRKLLEGLEEEELED